MMFILIYKIPIFAMILFAGYWIVVLLNKNTGETKAHDVETSQTRDELMRRSAAALLKKEGTVTSWKTRNGFVNEGPNTIISGQQRKKK